MVIADAVNLAARLEGLSKDFGASIIVSNKVIEKIPEADKYHTRFLFCRKHSGHGFCVEWIFLLKLNILQI